MRIVKLALVAAVAVIITSGSAQAITVKKKRDAPGEPTVVWALIGSFCAIKDWHPAVVDCKTSKEGDLTSRTLTLKDGAKIEERLTATEETSYSYVIVESPLPVKNYKATLSVKEDEDSPDRSEIHWEATFDAQGASEEDARKKIADIFEEGVAGMKKVAIDYEVKNGDASGGEAPSSGSDMETDDDDNK